MVKAKEGQIKVLYKFGAGNATIEKKFKDGKKLMFGAGAVVIDEKYRGECKADDRLIVV